MSIRELLRIPKGYKITKINYNEGSKEIHIHIEPYKRSKGVCSGCGNIHEETRHGIKIIKARDLPASEYAVYLHVTKRRYKCPIDGKINIEHIEWLKKKKTYPKVC